AKSYEVGLVRDLPFPAFTPDQRAVLRAATFNAAEAAKALHVENDESTNGFVAPVFLRERNGQSLQVLTETKARRAEDLWAAIARYSAQIDELMCDALGFSDHDRQVLAEELELPLQAFRADWDAAYDELLVSAYKTKAALPGSRLPGGI